MFRTVVMAALAASMIGACAHGGPSLAELDARREQNLAASTRIYEGVSVEQLRTAAFEVLKLINPDDMKFETRSDSLLATQNWWVVVLFTASSGQRWYEVKFTREGDAVRVTFAAAQSENAQLLVPSFSQPTFRDGITVSSQDKFWVNPKLFFERMDYMLGRKDAWPTCGEAEKAYRKTPLYLCGGWNGGVGVLDRAPPSRP